MAPAVKAAAESPVVAGRKRAAVHLAMLAPSDRNWILSHLPPELQDEIRTLLKSLRSLGLANLAALRAEIEALLAAPGAPREVSVVQRQPPEQVATTGPLERASADELGGILRELPFGCLDLLRARMPASRRHIVSAVQLRHAGADDSLRSSPDVKRVTEAFIDALAVIVEQRLAQSETKPSGIDLATSPA